MNNDNINIFSIVPIEILQDSRLTFRQMRVLIALLSFRNKTTNLTCPSREKLAERANLNLSHVTRTTSELCKLGWLEKTGNGAFSQSARYEICMPEFDEGGTLIQRRGVSQFGAGGVRRIGAGGYAESAQGKEQTRRTDKINRQEEQGKKIQTDFFADISQQVVDDYLSLRKSKKGGAMTQTAFNGLQREANKAGYTIEQALKTCCERNWIGFKADWVIEKINREQSITIAANSVFKDQYILEQTNFESEEYEQLN